MKTTTIEPNIITQDDFLDNLIGDQPPPKIFVLDYKGKYSCYCYQGIYGLACFETENGAKRFTEHISATGGIITELTFEEACYIASHRPKLTMIFLMDNIDDPKRFPIH